MKVSELFDHSPFLCKEMFWDAPPFDAVIDRVEKDLEVPKEGSSKVDKKCALFFRGTTKGLVLNAKNTKFLIRVLGGNNTDAWKGKTVTIYVDKSVRFGKQKCGGIRLAVDSSYSGDEPPRRPERRAPADTASSPSPSPAATTDTAPQETPAQ